MKIVRFLWLDSHSFAEPWVSNDRIEDVAPIPAIGYEVERTEKSITITVSPNIEASESHSPLTIPMVAITDGPHYVD